MDFVEYKDLGEIASEFKGTLGTIAKSGNSNGGIHPCSHLQRRMFRDIECFAGEWRVLQGNHQRMKLFLEPSPTFNESFLFAKMKNGPVNPGWLE